MIYSSLNVARKEFRLLTLHQQSHKPTLAHPLEDDPVCCTLSRVFRDDKPYYEALSYVWGDPDDVVTIYVNNDEH